MNQEQITEIKALAAAAKNLSDELKKVSQALIIALPIQATNQDDKLFQILARLKGKTVLLSDLTKMLVYYGIRTSASKLKQLEIMHDNMFKLIKRSTYNTYTRDTNSFDQQTTQGVRLICLQVL